MPDSSKKVQLSADSRDVADIVKTVLDMIKAPPTKPPWYRSSFKTAQEFIGRYWFWSTITLFVFAWIFFGADPFYPIKKWASASKEINALLEKRAYEQELSGSYVDLGNSLLLVEKFSDAEDAFNRALKCNPYGKEAEYGLAKSHLLSFSLKNEFDPQVISRRIELLRKSMPDKNKIDAPVAFAEARLAFAEDGSIDTVIKILKSAIKEAPGYAAANNLMGLAYIRSGDFQNAITSFGLACAHAKYNIDFLMNLANAYELSGNIPSADSVLFLCQKIDCEFFSTYLEIVRFQLVYHLNLNSPYIREIVLSIIDQFERDSLFNSPKNKDISLEYKVDAGSLKIKSWASKKAYCLQMSLLWQYLHGLTKNASPMPFPILQKQLIGLWDKASNEKQVLPVLLMNDINVMVKHHGDTLNPVMDKLLLIFQFAQGRTALTVVKRRF
jgi:Tfp pilus assembly protein PilF